MLTYLSKNCAHGTRLRCFLGPITYRFHVYGKIPYHRTASKVLNTKMVNLVSPRTYCTHNEDKRDHQTIDLPPLVEIKIDTGLKMVLSALVIQVKAHFNMCVPHDKDFNLGEFEEGSKHAMSIISKALAVEDYESLNDLVAYDTLEVLKEKIGTLTPRQKRLIAIDMDDIYRTLVYSIVIKNQDHEGYEENIVDASVLCFQAHNWRTEEMSPVDLLQNSILCDYKFRRVYKNSHGGPWIVTAINHFSFNYVIGQKQDD